MCFDVMTMRMPALSSRVLTLTLLAATGSLLGIHLGRTTIADVNPIYFDTPESTRFFADLAPGGYQVDDGPTFAPADFWSRDLDLRREPSCSGCTSTAEPEAFPTVSDPPAVPAHVPRTNALRDPYAIERYAYFPVTQEQDRLAKPPMPAEIGDPIAEMPDQKGELQGPEPVGM